MAQYMYQVSFTPEAWAKMVREPEPRVGDPSDDREALGGKLIGYWFTFGESDAIVIVQLPDNVSAAAASLAATSGSAVKSLEDHLPHVGRREHGGDAQGRQRGVSSPHLTLDRSGIVPGVTAALCASAQLGVSLTQRGVLRTVVVATPRAAEGERPSNWAAAVAAADTAVLYMAPRDFPAGPP